MKMNVVAGLISLLLLQWLATITTCLQCQVGTNFQSALQNETNMNNLECSGPDQVCQRMEATATAFDFLNVTISVTQCSNTSSCVIVTSCQGLDELFLSSDEESSGVDLMELQFQVNSCDVVCCNDPNCNSKTISSIRESTTAIQSDETPTTTSDENNASSQLSITKAVAAVIVLVSVLATIALT